MRKDRYGEGNRNWKITGTSLHIVWKHLQNETIRSTTRSHNNASVKPIAEAWSTTPNQIYKSGKDKDGARFPHREKGIHSQEATSTLDAHLEQEMEALQKRRLGHTLKA